MKLFKFGISLLLGVLFLGSCTSYKELIYFQPFSEQAVDTIINRTSHNFGVKKGDVLFIKVVTNIDEIDQMFNLNISAFGSALSGTENVGSGVGANGLYYRGYTVNDSGMIVMPVIDKLEVMGLTITEVQSLVLEKVSEYIEGAIVVVKIEDFRIAFVGSFNKVGVERFKVSTVNLMEAIAYAGGIARGGDRKNIMVIRPTIDGGSRVYTMDLTKSETIQNEAFQLQPNDVIYVPQRKVSYYKEETNALTFWVSTIASTISMFVLIATLQR